MKIVIISDIHDNLPNLEKCLSWCKENKIEKIICAGDLTNSETLQILSENFKGEIFIISGNGEIYDEDEIIAYDNINHGGRFAIFKIDGKNVGVCHEPFFIKEFPSAGGLLNPEVSGVAASAGMGFTGVNSPPREGWPKAGVGFQNNNCDIIFYGHTHKPWIEIKNDVQTVNPGTLGGVFTPATFAFWDTASGQLELKLLSLI
jgi:predicted phosphodiesterase